jgi:hypothetical protein
MKATLIKKAEGWYNLYQDNIGIGSTHSELQGYKLCQKNCDEIFGIVGVEKLAEQEVFQEYYDWGGEVFSEDYLISKRLHFIEGFNKAMELNKDKQFTLEDMKMAIELARETARRDEFLHSENSIIQQISEQAKKIDVEIEMEEYVKYVPKIPGNTVYPDRGVKPKLDENGCLRLKKLSSD